MSQQQNLQLSPKGKRPREEEDGVATNNNGVQNDAEVDVSSTNNEPIGVAVKVERDESSAELLPEPTEATTTAIDDAQHQATTTASTIDMATHPHYFSTLNTHITHCRDRDHDVLQPKCHPPKKGGGWWSCNSTPSSIGSLTYTSPEVLRRFGFVDGSRYAVPEKYELRAPPSPMLGGGHVHTIVPSTITKSSASVLRTLQYVSQMPASTTPQHNNNDTFIDHLPSHSVLRETILSAYDGSRLILDWRFAESSRRGLRARSTTTITTTATNASEAPSVSPLTPAVEMLVGSPGVMEGDLNPPGDDGTSPLDNFAPPSSWYSQLGVVAIRFPLKRLPLTTPTTPTTQDDKGESLTVNRRRIPIKRGIFLILPGLTSSIESGYIQTLVLHASSPYHGFDVVVANARGLGQVDTILDAPNMFCAAFTDDTKHILLNEMSTESLTRRGFYYAGAGAKDNSPIPVVVSGYSFGGILLSRALGEIGQQNSICVAEQLSPFIQGRPSSTASNEELVNAALIAHGSRTNRILGPNERMNIVAAGTVCSPLDMEAGNEFYTSHKLNYMLYRSPLLDGIVDYVRRHSHVLMTSRHAALRQVAIIAAEKEMKKGSSTDSVSVYEAYLRLKRRQVLSKMTSEDRNICAREANFDAMPNSVWELEKAVIAPVFGFEDHVDYYRKSTPIVPGHLDGAGRITTYTGGAIPIFCLCAEDDPIVGPGLTQPQQEELCQRWWSHRSGRQDEVPDHGGGGIAVYKCATGGHLGFLKGVFVERKDVAHFNNIAAKQDALTEALSAGRSASVTASELEVAHKVVFGGGGWGPNFMEEYVVTAMRNALATLPE